MRKLLAMVFAASMLVGCFCNPAKSQERYTLDTNTGEVSLEKRVTDLEDRVARLEGKQKSGAREDPGYDPKAPDPVSDPRLQPKHHLQTEDVAIESVGFYSGKYGGEQVTLRIEPYEANRFETLYLNGMTKVTRAGTRGGQMNACDIVEFVRRSKAPKVKLTKDHSRYDQVVEAYFYDEASPFGFPVNPNWKPPVVDPNIYYPQPIINAAPVVQYNPFVQGGLTTEYQAPLTRITAKAAGPYTGTVRGTISTSPTYVPNVGVRMTEYRAPAQPAVRYSISRSGGSSDGCADGS